MHTRQISIFELQFSGQINYYAELILHDNNSESTLNQI